MGLPIASICLPLVWLVVSQASFKICLHYLGFVSPCSHPDSFLVVFQSTLVVSGFSAPNVLQFICLNCVPVAIHVLPVCLVVFRLSGLVFNLDLSPPLVWTAGFICLPVWLVVSGSYLLSVQFMCLPLWLAMSESLICLPVLAGGVLDFPSCCLQFIPSPGLCRPVFTVSLCACLPVWISTASGCPAVQIHLVSPCSNSFVSQLWLVVIRLFGCLFSLPPQSLISLHVSRTIFLRIYISVS